MLSHLRNSQRQKTHVCDYTLRIFILRYKFHVSKQCCICQLSIINKEIIEYPKSEEIQQNSESSSLAPGTQHHSMFKPRTMSESTVQMFLELWQAWWWQHCHEELIPVPNHHLSEDSFPIIQSDNNVLKKFLTEWSDLIIKKFTLHTAA